MMFFRRSFQKTPVTHVPNPIPSSVSLTVDTNRITEDERETVENDICSTPTAVSPIDKTVHFSTDTDSNAQTSTNEHLSVKHPGLLRLFDSTVCTASIVISYLFSSKEPMVQEFLGKKLFDYSSEELDFYLPQLINMYIHVSSISLVIHDYITSR